MTSFSISEPNSMVYQSTFEKLIGKWTWVNSFSEISGVSETPRTKGHTYQIVITKDKILKLYKDNNLEQKSKFEISKDSLFLEGDKLIKSILFKGNDSLYLNDVYSDAPKSLYIREK